MRNTVDSLGAGICYTWIIYWQICLYHFEQFKTISYFEKLHFPGMDDFKSYQTVIFSEIVNGKYVLLQLQILNLSSLFLPFSSFKQCGKAEEDRGWRGGRETPGSVEMSGRPQAFSRKITVLLEALRSRLAMCRGSTLARHWRGRLQAMSQATRLISSCTFSLDTLSPDVLTCLSNSAWSGISFMCGLYNLWFSSVNKVIKSEAEALC